MNDEIIEYGVVERIEGEIAHVRVSRPDACNHCAAKGACETFGGKRDHLARTWNRCDAENGDRVKIRLPASGLLLSAFLVYFLPAAAMLAGAIVGHELLFKGTLSRDLSAIIGGLTLFALTLLGVFIHSYHRRDQILPEAFEVMAPADPLPGCNPVAGETDGGVEPGGTSGA